MIEKTSEFMNPVVDETQKLLDNLHRLKRGLVQQTRSLEKIVDCKKWHAKIDEIKGTISEIEETRSRLKRLRDIMPLRLANYADRHAATANTGIASIMEVLNEHITVVTNNFNMYFIKKLLEYRSKKS